MVKTHPFEGENTAHQPLKNVNQVEENTMAAAIKQNSFASMSYHRYDTLWKALVEDLTADLLRFYFPNAEEIFDFSKGFKFLSQELAELNPDINSNSPKRADILIQVYLKDGQVYHLLVLMEVHGYDDAGFTEKLYTCYYRLRDRYKVPVTTLVIYLAGRNKNNASFYTTECLGTKIRFDFNAYYVREQNEERLLQSKNPFAIAILTALADIKGKNKPEHLLYNSKMQLVRNLLKANYPKEKAKFLLNFITLYIKFGNDQLNTNFDTEVKILTEQKSQIMGIMEAVDYIRIEDAKEAGRLEVARKMLAKGLDINLIHECTEMPVSELRLLRLKMRKKK